MCTAAAGRHKRGEQNSNPATTCAWAHYVCITLNKTEEDFSSGVEMEVLIKVLFDSGIPLEKLLPETGRKRVKKDKKANHFPAENRDPEELG